jgi:hypothetical protein
MFVWSNCVKVLYAILLCLFVTAGTLAQGDPPLPSSIEEVYLAKDDGEGKAGEHVTEFRTTDVPIYCVVLLDSQTKIVVKMNFVAVNVAGVKPETKVVTASYTTKEGQNRVNFTGRPDGKWTPGKYRVDLFLDGKISKNVEFEIKSSGAVGGNTSASKYLIPSETPKPKAAKRPPRP